MYVSEDKLTRSQRAALSKMRAGDNVLVMGNAGCGKSTLVDFFIRECMDEGKQVLACAPTGIAALNLPGGATIHRAFNLRFRPVYPSDYRQEPPEQLRAADVVVIDEVSMLRIDLFETVAKLISRAETDEERPIQVIAIGDFFQLAPVVRDADRNLLKTQYPTFREGFCFESTYWDVLDWRPCILTEVVRQADPDFVAALDKARVADPSCIAYFNERANKKLAASEPIALVPTNAKADNINKLRILRERPAKKTKFCAVVDGDVSKSDRPTDDELELGVGVRVMAVVNDANDRYQNGSLGVVTDVHKTSFALADHGQSGSADGQSYVTVRFDSGVTCDVYAHQWDIIRPTATYDEHQRKNVIEDTVDGSFTQIPLRVAYAITIHKSQGQTYDACKVDPAVFSNGQLYVALSRVRSIDGLSLSKRIDPKELMASEEVLAFYRDMEDKVREDGGEVEATAADGAANGVDGEAGALTAEEIVAKLQAGELDLSDPATVALIAKARM